MVERRRAFGRYRRQRTNFYKETYRQARTRARRILTEARRRSFANYVSTLNYKTPMFQVWKRVRKVSGKFTPSPPPVLNVNGQTVAGSMEVVEALAETFVGVSSRVSRSPEACRQLQAEESRVLDISSRGRESNNTDFTMNILRSALSTCKDTSPGPYNIPSAFIRHVKDETLHFLLNIYKIWREANIPQSWKSAVTIPIPKPGKDSSEPLNYRPISLTACLIKLIEKNGQH